MDRNKNSGTFKIKSINETLKTVNKEWTKIESQKEQCSKRGRGKPPEVREIENMVDEEAYMEGNNEFLDVDNNISCINLTNDDGKLNLKKSEQETEAPKPLKVVLNSNGTTAQIENELQLNKENPEDFPILSASHSDDCHLNVEGGVTNKLDSASTELPFVQSSPLWETIKSSEPFLCMPQQPHFLPLEQYSNSRREGLAIGLMVAFSTIVNNIENFRISDPDEMIDTLNDLESHGFKLYNLRDLLMYFRALKEENNKWITNKVQATNESKSDGQSSECLLNEKLEATDKTIKELEQPMIELKLTKKSLDEEKLVKLTEVEGFDFEIKKLQNDGKTIENSYLAAERSLSAQGKFNFNSFDLNEPIETFDLVDAVSNDVEKELNEERVNENKSSIYEESSDKEERGLTFEQVSKYFYMPIAQASKELNMCLTALKKKCRELDIPRWPHRKVKSLQTLIRNVKEIGREEGVIGEEELKNIEKLEQEKKLMEKEPTMRMEEKTKRLRQAFFTANYKKRRLQSRFIPEAAADHV